MKQIRRLLLAVVIPSVIMGTMVSGALGGSASAAAGAKPLTLTAIKPQFPAPTCLNPSCLLQAQPIDAKATSNLSTGAGSHHADAIIDYTDFPPCNTVDEHATFTFANGTISVASQHEDCATAGLRINTTFQVTGGTGAFQGASGSGREFSSASFAAPTIYQGTISF